VAGEAAEWADLCAERVTALGGFATGTVRMAASSSALPEFPSDITDSMD
jgi:starvation-inducible DNA-binding protein